MDEFYPAVTVLPQVSTSAYVIDPEFISLYSGEEREDVVRRTLMEAAYHLRAGHGLVVCSPQEEEFFVEVLVNDEGLVRVDAYGAQHITAEELAEHLLSCLSHLS